MSTAIKALRGQVRQIVQELLPQILTKELQSALYKSISTDLSQKLEFIHNQLKDQLKTMEDRGKDVQSLLVRESMRLEQARAELSKQTT